MQAHRLGCHQAMNDLALQALKNRRVSLKDQIAAHLHQTNSKG